MQKVFTPGKLTVLLDAQAGSSGKGRVGAYVCQNADNWTFACNCYMPNAGHTVQHRPSPGFPQGRRFFYKTLNSCAAQHHKYEKLYIGPGAVIDLKSLFREIEESGMPAKKLGISPMATILQDADRDYELGLSTLEGAHIPDGHRTHGGPLAKSGTTASGCGAARARKVLRRNTRLARDERYLRGSICDVPGEIMTRLDRGESGLMELAQGFQLSNNLPEFHPYCTSRNVTVSAGLDDMMIPPFYAGNVILNLRTYPIRTCSNKFVDKRTGYHLTEAEVCQRQLDQSKWGTFEVVSGNTGPEYDDQQEITWDDVTESSGSPEDIHELSSVTKLPRRVFTFSKQNVRDAIRYNRTAGQTMLVVNFMDYVDHVMSGVTDQAQLTYATYLWLHENLEEHIDKLVAIGTGPNVEDTIALENRWTPQMPRSTATCQ